MKKIKILSAALLIFFSASFAQTTSWKFDQSHTQIKFTVKHLVISEVTGNFKKFDGLVTTEGDDFSTAKINFTAETNSIFTDNEKRDAHLKSDDFFNAEKFPQLTFVGKSMKKTGKNKFKLTGDLTIRDVTKSVTLDVVYNGSTNAWGSTRAGFKLSGTINRFDYNLKWNTLIESGGAVVSKEVKLTCDVELIKENQK
jgi:polyisoprenoid-binding protein YceI